MSTFQKKSVVLDGHEFVLHGRRDDWYFSVVSDNFEPEFSALCHRLVAEDAVCLDIGAHIGARSFSATILLDGVSYAMILLLISVGLRRTAPRVTILSTVMAVEGSYQADAR